MLKTRSWLVPGALAASCALAAAAEVRPALGRHAAELCVATASAAVSCGPAQVDLRRDGSMRVRVDDLVYRLQLHSSQVDVALVHGAVQIDEFTAPYEWSGHSLRFNDDERKVRYEVRFSKRSPNEQDR